MRSEGMRFFPARRVEPGDEHLLPDRLDLEWVFADERARALLERVLRAAFADPGDPHVGLDSADHVALIEQGIQSRWLVDSDARDLAAGSCARAGWGRPRRSAGAAARDLNRVRRSMRGRIRQSSVVSRQSLVVSPSRQSRSSVPVVSPSRQSQSSVPVVSPSRRSTGGDEVVRLCPLLQPERDGDRHDRRHITAVDFGCRVSPSGDGAHGCVVDQWRDTSR